jgi:hypothetical protein
MADRDAEISLDLRHALQTADDGGRGLWADLHPPPDWHDCPDCGTQLSGQSLFHTGPDDVLAVTYSCTNETCLARWSGKRPPMNSSTEERPRSVT